MELLIIICLYFLPAMCASMRGTQGTGGILVLNIFLGWTAIGWIIALVWAFGGKKEGTE